MRRWVSPFLRSSSPARAASGGGDAAAVGEGVGSCASAPPSSAIATTSIHSGRMPGNVAAEGWRRAAEPALRRFHVFRDWTRCSAVGAVRRRVFELLERAVTLRLVDLL